MNRGVTITINKEIERIDNGCGDRLSYWKEDICKKNNLCDECQGLLDQTIKIRDFLIKEIDEYKHKCCPICGKTDLHCYCDIGITSMFYNKTLDELKNKLIGKEKDGKTK